MDKIGLFSFFFFIYVRQYNLEARVIIFDENLLLIINYNDC